MATINCANVNTIGTQAETLCNVTQTTGKELITSFSNTIENLKSHWKGSDAVANITDLSKVYTAVTDLVKNLETLIVDVNNNAVLKLQKEILASGGSCTLGNELSTSLGGVSSTIAVPTENGESWVDVNNLVADASEFSEFLNKFKSFVSSLNEAKDVLFNNWTEGAGRDTVDNLFKTFNNNVPDYENQIKTVIENMNTVAQNKSSL